MKRAKKQTKQFIEIDPEAVELLRSGAKVALWVVGTVAALTVSVALPGLAQVLGQEIGKHQRAEMKRIYIRERYDPLGREGKKYEKSRQALYYLRRNGYISFDGSLAESVIRLTEKGKKYLRKLHVIAQAPKKPLVWDKTWWVVLADVPTKSHRYQAERLRLRLKASGFYPLQRTVWVHPYDPTRLVNELTAYYGLGKFVTVMQVTRLDSEDLGVLKKHFSL